MTSMENVSNSFNIIETTPVPLTSVSSYAIIIPCIGYVLSLIFTVTGNGLVIVAVAKIRAIQNTSNTFVAGLAMVDMCTSVNIVFKIIQTVDPTAYTDYVSCQIKMMLVCGVSICSTFMLLGKSNHLLG